MDELEQTPVYEMTTDEKLNEILILLRGFGAALTALADSPMGRMLPGVTQQFSSNGRK